MSLAREARVSLALVALSVAVFLAWCVFLRVPLVDDAAISIAYGRSLFSGYGLRLTRNSQVVEAFSNPLWTVILGLSVPLGLNPVTLATRLGYSLSALSLVFVVLWGPCSRGSFALRFEDALGAVLPCTVTAFGYWSCAGLETGLLAMLLALSGALWLYENHCDKGFLSAVTLSMVCGTRPEGVLYALCPVAISCALRPRPWAALSRREVRWCTVLGLSFGGFLALRFGLFASWVPNTYYAKRYGEFFAWEYLRSFARENSGLVIAMALALPLTLGARSPRGMLAMAWLAMCAAFIVSFRGDWMPEWRFIAPLAPCMAALVSAGASGLRERGHGSLSVVALVLVVSLGGVKTLERSRELRGHQEVSYGGVYKDAVVLGKYLDSLGFRRPLLGLPDIGGLALALPEAEVMDTAMLADVSLARHIRSRRMMEDYLRFEGPPSFLDVHGPSGFLAELPALMADYVALSSVAPELHLNAGNYILKHLDGTRDPRCPGGRERVLAMFPGELARAMELELSAGEPVRALRLWRCAWSYQPEGALPSVSWRRGVAHRAMDQSRREEGVGRWEKALRYSSLATVLGGHDAHDRRRTEVLRERVFQP